MQRCADRPARTTQPDAGPPPHVTAFHRDGYAVVRGVFTPDEIARMAAAFDRLWATGLSHPKSFRDGNVFWRIGDDAALGRIVRYLQWPAYVDADLDRVRTDARLLALLRPLIGGDLKQIINQLHWKPPGAAGAEFGFHQDIRFRRPRTAYRDPARAYVQTGIAIDPHRAESGAMLVVPGSHRLGELTDGNGQPGGPRVMNTALDLADLVRLGVDPGDVRVLELEPGDVALWHLFTLHGSGRNRSRADRRFYLNGYVRAADCDRGALTFQGGVPVPLGPPVLIHYEDLFRDPGPRYVDD